MMKYYVDGWIIKHDEEKDIVMGWGREEGWTDWNRSPYKATKDIFLRCVSKGTLKPWKEEDIFKLMITNM